MKRIVLCEKNNISALCNLEGDYQLVSSDQLDTIVLDNTEIIIEWNSRVSLRHMYSKISSVGKISFLFGDICVDMTDQKLVDVHMAQAIATRNYAVCKTINEASIETAIIRADTYMHSYPTEIQLETTDRCNASCIMCNHFYKDGSLSITQNRQMVDALAEVFPYIRVVYLHGNGEPFLVGNIEEHIDEMASYGISFMTNTNLTVLKEQTIDILNRHFTEINISCDSATAEGYEYVRRGLHYNLFVDNCRKVRQCCPNLYMRMCCIVMRQNVMQLQQIVQFAYGLGFDEIIFSELSADVKLQNEEDVMTQYPHVMKAQLADAKSCGMRIGIRVETPQYTVDDDDTQYASEMCAINATELFHDDEFFDNLAIKLKSLHQSEDRQMVDIGSRDIPTVDGCVVTGVCDWCVERPFVDLQGNVCVCCINQHIRLGNLFESSFEDIWNSDSARKIRETFYNGNLPIFCSGCEFLLHNNLHRLFVQDTSNLHKKLRLSDITKCK